MLMRQSSSQKYFQKKSHLLHTASLNQYFQNESVVQIADAQQNFNNVQMVKGMAKISIQSCCRREFSPYPFAVIATEPLHDVKRNPYRCLKMFLVFIFQMLTTTFILLPINYETELSPGTSSHLMQGNLSPSPLQK
ncbi:hypothetical protein OXYTRIMIC_785 [Oxytricha trifallax]|uniref:Uncharacterized protein n=1 Tax=Oxytricha trifallax TaxID=1172189 RepID=A0A073HWT2_9SPIT|nr:hypothetical protein OXYTRIMIC_785 [Oxytricha trifallax]